LPEEHRAWLAQTLASPDRHLFTVEADARPVGQVRLDKRGSEVEVSISLVPEARGRGIGSQAIGLANGVARELGGRRATAVIRDGNLASLRAFTSLGYIENRREGQLIYLSMVLLDD
jgi:RimJ/RimL family protein N-acetyltransferase